MNEEDVKIYVPSSGNTVSGDDGSENVKIYTCSSVSDTPAEQSVQRP